MLESEKTADDDVGTKEGTDDGTGGPIAMDADQKSEPKRRGRKSTPVVRIETGETFPNAAAASKRAGCSRQTMQLRRRPQQDRRRAPMGIRRAKGAELEDPRRLPRHADEVSRREGGRSVGGVRQRRAGRPREHGGRT
ncbi:MAG: hypothetical protein JTJ29_11755 [Bifidobacterium sp.]|nr:hypothetical protein [Bifidobacterium sp.]